METIILRHNSTVHGKHYIAGTILDVDDNTADVLINTCKSAEIYDEHAEQAKQPSVKVHQPSSNVTSGE